MTGATMQARRGTSEGVRPTVLVAGATGLLGGLICQRLLAEGFPVRALVRPTTDAASLAALGAVLAPGDLTDRASLDAACDGVQVVITTANSAARGPPDTPETVEHQGNENLVDAAKAAGVRRFVFTSALVADEASPVPFLAGKGRTERLLEESGMEYTILRPTMFMEAWIGAIIGGPMAEGRPVTLIGPGTTPHSFVSMQDIAAFAAKSATHSAAKNRRLDLGGPEALTWMQVVQTFREVTGMEIPVEHIEPGELIPSLPDVFSHLMAASEQQPTEVAMDKAAAEFDVPLTSVADFARGMLGTTR